MGHVIWHNYDSPQWLVHGLAQTLEQITRQAIEDQGRATWVLSGGSTPKPLYQHLAKRPLAWDKLTCLLTDERCLPEGHPKTNAYMLWDTLLKHHPETRWLPIVDCAQRDAPSTLSVGEARLQTLDAPHTLVLLGMGPDGHTASLFPTCQPSLTVGLDANTTQSLIYTQSPQYPQNRISLTFPALTRTHHLFLLIMGEHKRARLEDSSQSKPIHRLIEQSPVDIHVYWSAQPKEGLG